MWFWDVELIGRLAIPLACVLFAADNFWMPGAARVVRQRRAAQILRRSLPWLDCQLGSPIGFLCRRSGAFAEERDVFTVFLAFWEPLSVGTHRKRRDATPFLPQPTVLSRQPKSATGSPDRKQLPWPRLLFPITFASKYKRPNFWQQIAKHLTEPVLLG